MPGPSPPACPCSPRTWSSIPACWPTAAARPCSTRCKPACTATSTSVIPRSSLSRPATPGMSRRSASDPGLRISAYQAPAWHPAERFAPAPGRANRGWSRFVPTSNMWTRRPAREHAVSTYDAYTIPVEPGTWDVPAAGATRFSWEYDDGRQRLLDLYQRGKDKQWDAAKRIEWDLPVNPSNIMETPDEFVPIYGSRQWEILNESERETLGHHL